MKTFIVRYIFTRMLGLTLAAVAMIVVGIGCQKEKDFLNAKSSNSAVIPSTVSDYQAILDYTQVMNSNYSVLGLLGCDNYYLSGAVYNSLSGPKSTAYIWATDIWQGQPAPDWDYEYQVVSYANVCLDGLKTATLDTNGVSYDNVEGSALFYRAFAFYNIATLFCKAYDSTTAGTDLGIPLVLTSDVNAKTTRATVQQTYAQIIGDLKTAVGLLPETPANLTRPSSVAANALLAKVYLAMGDYPDAENYANQALSQDGNLLNFNSSTVSPGSYFPFPIQPASNPEIIFFAEGDGYGTVYPLGNGIIDSNLYASYNVDDLRKSVFYVVYNGNVQFSGSYDGYGDYNFSGIATNEIYLIRAECNARLGNTGTAMSDLNALLLNRYVTGTYTPLTISNADSALTIILTERRKELPLTANVRWEDLRRLGSSPYAVTLTRVVNGTTYTLSPNDPRYVYPIPDNEIQLTGIQQNSR
jgi:starch-binding outer membrane protein, SusD/RagB family